jgi:hypothetical protein
MLYYQRYSVELVDSWIWWVQSKQTENGMNNKTDSHSI